MLFSNSFEVVRLTKVNFHHRSFCIKPHCCIKLMVNTSDPPPPPPWLWYADIRRAMGMDTIARKEGNLVIFIIQFIVFILPILCCFLWRCTPPFSSTDCTFWHLCIMEHPLSLCFRDSMVGTNRLCSPPFYFLFGFTPDME